jgi:DNA-directed RNA polymerase specialized sigma24 family protein
LSVLRPDLPMGGQRRRNQSRTVKPSALRSRGTLRVPGSCSLRAANQGGGVIEEAFRSHRAEIYRYLRRRTAKSDRAEELTQQVFADAAIAVSRMDAGPGAMLGLLYSIARRRLADDARRNRQRAERLPLEDVDEELAAPDDNSDLARGIRARSRGYRTRSDERSG